jgi:hypothetical protein
MNKCKNNKKKKKNFKTALWNEWMSSQESEGG